MSGKNLKIRITMGPSSTVYSDNGVAAALPQSQTARNPFSPMDVTTKRIVAVGASAAILLAAGWLIFSSNDDPSNLVTVTPMAPAESVPVIADTSTDIAIPAPPPLPETMTKQISVQATTAAPPALAAQSTAKSTTEAKKPAAKPPKTATKSSDRAPAGSKNVSRAVLTSGIARLEPVDRLGSTLSADAGKKNLFFFTEIVALKGTTVTHRWKRDGQIVGSQKFRVGSNRYRVYSNKTIAPDQTGQWQVEVLDGGGKTLQIAQFRFE